jgi:GNAT superfamily N-acetyltransferase
MENIEITIREYKEEDKNEVLSCIINLQEYERSLEPGLKTKGEDIAESFLSHILRADSEQNGKLLVAILDNKIIGFVNGWVEEESNSDDLLIRKWFYISDLDVLPEYRGQHIGSRLMKEMENYAKSLNLAQMQVGALAKNINTRRFYEKQGYRDYELTLLKEI